mgnify:CR=1 FL=1
MSSTLLVMLISVGVVAFFVVAMSLTLIFKGHNIKSEISENENMRERGIKCVIQETRELDNEMYGSSCDVNVCGGDCSSCTTDAHRK